MENKSELIRVSKPTKELLSNMKIIEEESFDSVINRLLQTKVEECIKLNNQTQQVINERLNNVSQGKVISSKELLDRVKQMNTTVTQKV